MLSLCILSAVSVVENNIVDVEKVTTETVPFEVISIIKSVHSLLIKNESSKIKEKKYTIGCFLCLLGRAKRWKSKKHGKTRTWTETLDGKKHGTERRTGGIFVFVTKFVHGKMHGERKVVMINQKILSVFYRDGKRHGKATSWFAIGGAKRTEATFVDGKCHGKLFFFHHNGKIKEERRFCNDRECGIIRRYLLNGSVMEHTVITRGKTFKECKFEAKDFGVE